MVLRNYQGTYKTNLLKEDNLRYILATATLRVLPLMTILCPSTEGTVKTLRKTKMASDTQTICWQLTDDL
jgi:hypothetical protein